MSYKFIFDTSAIDQDSIKAFQNAGLREKCASKQFILYITPSLLQECLGNIPTNGQNMTNFNLVFFRFILSLDIGAYFKEINEILTAELEGKFSNEFLSRDNSSEELQAIIKAAAGEQLIAPDAADIELAKKKMAENKNKVDIYLKSGRNSSKPKDGGKFSDYLKESFCENSILYIKEHLSSGNQKDVLIEYWQKNKLKCPYFNKFIEGMMFFKWCMQCRRDMKIDKNGMDDIEHLVYLLGADGIVSEDKFLKVASQEIFPDKDFLSVKEFIAKIS